MSSAPPPALRGRRPGARGRRCPRRRPSGPPARRGQAEPPWFHHHLRGQSLSASPALYQGRPGTSGTPGARPGASAIPGCGSAAAAPLVSLAGDRTGAHRHRPRREAVGRLEGKACFVEGPCRASGCAARSPRTLVPGPGSSSAKCCAPHPAGRAALSAVRCLRGLPMAVRRLSRPVGVEAHDPRRATGSPRRAARAAREGDPRGRRALPLSQPGGLPGGLRRPALSRRHSHLLQPIDDCLLLHPALAGLVARLGDLARRRRSACACRFHGGAAGGDRGPVPDQAADWGCGVVQRRGGRLVPAVGPDSIVETVDGVPFRITGDAFFQNHTAGAEALVRLVSEALEPSPMRLCSMPTPGAAVRPDGGTLCRRRDRRGVLCRRGGRLAPQCPARTVAGESGGRRRRGGAAVPECGLDLAVVDPPARDWRAWGPGRRGRQAAGPGLRLVRSGLAGPRHAGPGRGRLPARLGTTGGPLPQTFHIEAVAAFRAG